MAAACGRPRGVASGRAQQSLPARGQAFTVAVWVRPEVFAKNDWGTFFSCGAAEPGRALLLALDGEKGDGHLCSGGYWRLGQALTALWDRDLKQVLQDGLFSHLDIPADRWDWLPGRVVHDTRDFYPAFPGHGEYIDPPYEVNGHVVRGAPDGLSSPARIWPASVCSSPRVAAGKTDSSLPGMVAGPRRSRYPRGCW